MFDKKFVSEFDFDVRRSAENFISYELQIWIYKCSRESSYWSKCLSNWTE